ncbi:MAG: hypothetical protein P8L45_09300, partial [Longimicrobiales bacterium]|nr:hypothetical protein [Longimicrobiales bacterium]
MNQWRNMLGSRGLMCKSDPRIGLEWRAISTSISGASRVGCDDLPGHQEAASTALRAPPNHVLSRIMAPLARFRG